MIKILVALVILAGAYVVTFGLPLPESNQPQDGSAKATASQDGGGRPDVRVTSVSLGTLEENPYTNVLRSIGSAESLDNTVVVSSGDGTVIASSIVANANVALGDVLVQLDNDSEILDLEIAKATLQQASSTAERYTTIQSSGVSGVSEMVLQEARMAERLAQVQVKLAQLALNERTIRAPIAGRLGLTGISVGDHLSESAEIVTIDNTETLVAQFEVPERAIRMVSIGTPVRINTPVYTGRIFNGEITEFDSRLDSVTRSVTVRANIDNREGRLWAGMTFAIRMINQTESLPTIEATAVSWSRDGAGIWSVVEGTAKRVPITILYRSGNSVWIETDLPVGSQVVIEGAQKLRDGIKVQDINSPALATAANGRNNEVETTVREESGSES